MKIKTFDTLAPFYDIFVTVFRRNISRKIVSRLKPEQDDMVLNVGGGTGYNSARIASLCRRVIVLDVSFKMLKRAKKYRHLVLVVGDARALPFKSKRFDIVLAVDSLHHVGDYGGVLKEIGRTGRDKVFVAEFYGRTLIGKLFTRLEKVFFPVLYRRPEAFCGVAAHHGIAGDYEYISGFEYFFLGRVQQRDGS